MARKTKSQRMAEVHDEALRRFDLAYAASPEDRRLALMARRFVNIRGAQWDWDEAGDWTNRIKLEIDHISSRILSVKNEYRKNRISAKFLPADGSDADELADTCASLFRADTQGPAGREARDSAFDSALEGGFGGVRLRAEAERGERQRICVEPVHDAESSLYFDINARRKDKSDADWAFYVEPWSDDAYKDEFGEDGTDWPAALRGRYHFAWFDAAPKRIWVAEYFVIEELTRQIRVFTSEIAKDDPVEVAADDLTEDRLSELLATGYVEGEPRDEEYDQVSKYILNGARVLSGPEVIPGEAIPLIPQYGIRTVIDGVERFRGLVLKPMDAQIVYNLQASKVAETAASSGVEKPIFHPQQVLRHQAMWQDDNRDNNPFLLIDPMTDPASGQIIPGGPIGYTKPPQLAPAVAALIDLTKQDMADLLGNPENAEQIQPDVSGVALDLVQGRVDMQSYIFMDEAADTERRIAEVWLGMAREVYVEDGRTLKTMGDDGARGSVTLGRQILDAKTGKVMTEVDLARAEYDVEVDVGPTSASRRAAIVRTLVSLISGTADPQMQMILTQYAIMNLESEGWSDLRDYARKRLVAAGVIKPTPEEQQEMDAAAQNQQPDPNTVLAGAMAKESEAKAMRAQAETAKIIAQTEQVRAETADTLVGIPIAQQESAVRTAKQIAEGVTGGGRTAD